MFAAARWHGVPAPGPYDGLREALLGDDGTIRATILGRSTQTNEVGRLATLTPAFAEAGRRAARGPAGGRGQRRAVPLPGPVLLRLVDQRGDSSRPAPAPGSTARSRGRSPARSWSPRSRGGAGST